MKYFVLFNFTGAALAAIFYFFVLHDSSAGIWATNAAGFSMMLFAELLSQETR